MAKILVVDDEPDLELLLRQRFRRRVRKGELSLVFAQNGVEALAKLREHPDVDMVLSDINMPQMDGLTLLSQLNELSYDIRAVIVTAYGDMRNIRTAMNRGAFDFVTKPLDFEDLEATIAKTLSHLEVMREALRSRDELVAIRQELGVAARMQESILPTHFPNDPRYQIHAWMTPAKEVGGRLLRLLPARRRPRRNRGGGRVGEGRSGRPLHDGQPDDHEGGRRSARSTPALCLAEVNRLLVESNEESMFVTLFYASFDPETRVLEFANAGHNLPHVVKASGEVAPIDCEAGLVLGVMPDFSFPGGSVRLDPGDTIFFYTDGITEAMDDQGVEFGDDELAVALADTAGLTAGAVCRKVVKAVQEHAGDADQSDDITCLALRSLELPT